MIALIDSQVANLASVAGALRRLGAEVEITADVTVVRSASRVILPGVGSAGRAMAVLRASGLAETIPRLSAPVLGICLGMQVLFASSEEDGGTPGLGILPGAVRRLRATPQEPVPHMGWNQVRPARPDHPLLRGLAEESYFYFVHSFAAPVSETTLAETTYAGASFAAAAGLKNFVGVQFHPERSSDAGSRVLRNFLEM